LHPDDFISIHVTDDATRDMNGGNFDIAICLANPRAEQSQELGTAIYRQLSEHGGVQKKPTSEKGAYVLRHNTAPSVLLEFGDIKDKKQMEWINNDEQLDKLCHAILAGVVETHK
jgi:N-acetylmuramoyl-L-alanine amidase